MTLAIALLLTMEPIVFTLCDRCNKEFPINFGETVLDWISVFARCPHCNFTNKRWLKVPKKQEGKKKEPEI